VVDGGESTGFTLVTFFEVEQKWCLRFQKPILTFPLSRIPLMKTINF
jgi:hypothetical protein